MNAPDFIDELLNYIAERRLTIEVCVSSNLQTHPNTTIDEHPVWEMLDRKMSVAICTDNRLVSHTSICKEMRLLVDTKPQKFGYEQIRSCCIYGFKRSFLPIPYVKKREYVRQCRDYFDRVVEKHKDLQG